MSSKVQDFDPEAHKEQIDIKNMVSAGLEIIASEPHEALCEACREIKSDVARRRLNTMYYDDESNWFESCHDCFEERVEHYKELWSYYYS